MVNVYSLHVKQSENDTVLLVKNCFCAFINRGNLVFAKKWPCPSGTLILGLSHFYYIEHVGTMPLMSFSDLLLRVSCGLILEKLSITENIVEE